MKLKKRKIKYAAAFFLLWFALLVFLVDGVFGFLGRRGGVSGGLPFPQGEG